MIVPKDKAFPRESEDLRDLRVLEAIEANPRVSQRELASSLGVAVGIANACIHTLVRKGSVKIRGENNRSLTYHLTKQGVLQKSRLAVEWTRNTINFYAHARQMVSEEIAVLVAAGARMLVVYGSRELAEIAIVVAGDYPDVRIVGAIRAEGEPERAAVVGVPVGGLDLLQEVRPDAILICSEPDPDVLEFMGAVQKDGRPMTLLSLYDRTI